VIGCARRSRGTPGRKRLTEAQALLLIRTVHREARHAYGARRIHAELRGRGYRIGLPRVERFMRENGIQARHQLSPTGTLEPVDDRHIVTSAGSA
jgi:hypothetical protein